MHIERTDARRLEYKSSPYEPACDAQCRFNDVCYLRTAVKFDQRHCQF